MSRDLSLFFKYITPSMAGMLIVGTYSIVDTIFIGKAMGKSGLAAAAVTWPLVMLVNAFGDMIGTGAAIIVSQSRGANDPERAQTAFGSMITLLFCAALLFSGGILLFLTPILQLMGAETELLPGAREYAIPLIAGAAAQMFGMGWIAVMRNDGHPFGAMWLVVIGLLLNILLDYLFIFPLGLGLRGAALATVLSQIIVCAVGICHFLSSRTDLRFRKLRPQKEICIRIFQNGIPTLGNQLAIIAMLFLHNLQALRYGAVNGLAAYTLVATIESMGSLLMTGLSAGVQPLVAYFYGSGKHRRKRRIGNYGYLSALLLGILMMLLSIFGAGIFPGWFGLEGDVAALAGHGLILSAPAFILLGVIRVAGYYFQSTGKLLKASALIYGDSFAALPLCLFLLPLYYGLNGVWLAMPVSRLILFVLLCWFWFGGKQNAQRPISEISQ